MLQYPFFIAEVRNVKDPWKSGRVQLRMYGLHNDEQNVKDEELPWAVPVQDITSAATAKVGTAPVGMMKGSRVIGVFLDKEGQNPVILGTYARAAKPVDRNDNTRGEEGSDKQSKGIDLPSNANPQTNNNRGRAPNNPRVGGRPVDTQRDRYNDAQFRENGEGQEAITTARRNFAPNADRPTTAAAEPNQDLPGTVRQVDPQAASAVLQNMLSMLSMIVNMSNATSPAATTKIVTDALAGALAILANKYGFERVIDIFNNCLAGDGIERIAPEYRELVKEALAKLIENAAKNGPSALKLSEKPVVIKYQVGGTVPLPIFGFPPDLYVQQYYTVENDPYPGYIQWKGPNGDFVYTVRGAELHFPTADDHIYSMAEEQLAKDLEPYIIRGSITPEELNFVLDKNSRQVQNNGMNKSVGQNSNQNLMQLLSMLLGILGSIINKSRSTHIPQSVMDQGSVNQSLERFSRNMSIAKRMQQESRNAFTLPGAASGLGNLPGLNNLTQVAQQLAQVISSSSQRQSQNDSTTRRT